MANARNRRICGIAAILGAALSTAAPCPAQDLSKYPERPIRIVVPATAGGTQDTLARLIAPKLSERLKQSVVIDNRNGAGGMMGAAAVAKAAPDGYTLLVGGPSFAVNAAVRANLPYDPIKDFSGVAPIGYSTTVLLVTPALGVRSVKELIAVAKAQPGKILFGSAGAGSGTFMNAERFRLAAGIDARHVGFKGQPEFLLEIAAGRIHYGVGGLFASLPLIKDGKLVPLAVTTDKRSTILPDVPTSAEVLPGWGRDGTQGVLAPSRTPRATVQRLNQEVTRILMLPETQDRFQAVDFNVVTGTPEAFDRMLRSDIEAFSRVAKASGLIAK